MASSRPLVVVNLERQSVCLLLKSPPGKKLGPRVWKNASNRSTFKLCRGGQYVMVMSLRGHLRRTEVAEVLLPRVLVVPDTRL